MMKIRRYFQDAGLIIFLASLFVIAIILLAEASVTDVGKALFLGAFGTKFKVAQVISVWIPLTLAALGLTCSFRAGLWNIGVEGQIVAGAMASYWIISAGQGNFSPQLLLFLSFLGAMTAGGVWAMLSGVLKNSCGIHEIFSGLGLNFTALSVNLWLIFGPWKRPGVASMSGTEIFPRDFWLETGLLRFSPAALILTISALLLCGAVFKFTRFGLSLKAVGFNRQAAPLYGLSPERLFLLAFLISGAMAGLSGFVQVTAVYHRIIPAISSNYGYLALLVALLAQNRLIPLVFISFFFAALNVGSIQLPMVLGVDSSLVGIIQGAIVLSALLVFNAGKNKGAASV